jgi:SSS family solute:Na+ symporter
LDLYVTSNFLHFAIFLFIVSSIVMYTVSLTAPAYTAEKLKNVVYVKPERSGEGFNPTNRDFWLTIALIAGVLLIWFVFSPLALGG